MNLYELRRVRQKDRKTKRQKNERQETEKTERQKTKREKWQKDRKRNEGMTKRRNDKKTGKQKKTKRQKEKKKRQKAGILIIWGWLPIAKLNRFPFDRGRGEVKSYWRGAFYKGAPLTQSPHLTGGHLRPSKSKRAFPISSRALASCVSFIFVTWWWNWSLHCDICSEPAW